MLKNKFSTIFLFDCSLWSPYGRQNISRKKLLLLKRDWFT